MVEKVLQEEGEIGVQVEQGAAQKTIYLQYVAVGADRAVVGCESSEPYAAAVERIDEAEAIQLALGHQVERNLSGGIEIVAAEIEFEAQRLLVVQIGGCSCR